MPAGLCHHVFEAELAGGGSVVLRLGRPETAAAIRGGVAWHGRLARAGVPVPALLAFSLEGGYPYMLLERLPGRDLLFEYPSMNDSELRALAAEMAAVQAKVAALPRARGYGFATDYGDPGLVSRWAAVVEKELERSRRRLESSGACDTAVVDAVARRLPAFRAEWERIEPVAFLDDTTTKNVIVHRGRLSGIVDTDTVCFGDPLYTLGLTRMALLSEGLGTAYVDHWADCLGLDSAARARVELYTAVFCVDFLSELGQRFNRDDAAAVDPARKALLLGILDAQLARVDEGLPG
jgi:aminoglycoside phosphotransferase (APT) family kinase protein